MIDFGFPAPEESPPEPPPQRPRRDGEGREIIETLERAGEPLRHGAPPVKLVALLFMAGLLGLAARLFQLQVWQHPQYAVRASSNFQREDIVPSVRGQLLTRDGVVLATNRQTMTLVYHGRRNSHDPAQAIPDWERIRYLAGIAPEQLVNGQPREPDHNREAEVVLARGIPEERWAALAEYLVMAPSLELRPTQERIYPQGKLAAHLLGYVREASETQVKERQYERGDLVGVSGLEYSLQSLLQGKNGLRRLEVSASGKPLRDTVLDPGRRGLDITLTIDSSLQRAAEQALREGLADVNANRRKWGKPPETLVRGAIIAIDPRNGEVLALASAPTFDPNWFSRTPSPDPAARNWAVDPKRPNATLDAVTSNRVVQPYAPGSVFKPATALMYVEKWGNFSVSCTPNYWFKGQRFKNWASFNLGVVEARRAVAYSCNPWFYSSAARAEPSAYATELKSRLGELGYLKPTGLELVGEKVGTIHDPADYRRLGTPWYPGFGLNMSIGQGDTLVTPAQQALVLATILNEGRKRPLTVVRAEDGKGQPLRPPVSVIKGNAEGFKLIKEGMEWTTTLRLGTATHQLGPGVFPIRTAGKTGTAETTQSRQQGYSYTHAWYEGYGPVEQPNFLVVAFFQNGGEGSEVALKAVKKMFAARWCVKLGEGGQALPASQQQLCPGELEQMHRVKGAQP